MPTLVSKRLSEIIKKRKSKKGRGRVSGQRAAGRLLVEDEEAGQRREREGGEGGGREVVLSHQTSTVTQRLDLRPEAAGRKARPHAT